MRLVPMLALSAGLIAGPAFAQDSIGHLFAASENGSEFVGNLGAAGIQAVAGVVVLPIALVGGASVVAGASAAAGGSVVADVGAGMVKDADQALQQTWGPLKVDEKVVTAPDPAPLPAHR